MSEVISGAWLRSREIILHFLGELRPDLTRAELEHNAGVVLARLAQHEPPILVAFVDELKE